MIEGKGLSALFSFGVLTLEMTDKRLKFVLSVTGEAVQRRVLYVPMVQLLCTPAFRVQG